MTSESMLDQIPDVLKWARCDGVFDSIYERHLSRIRAKVWESVDAIYRRDDMTGRWLSDALASMPNRSVDRFLSAPETCHHVSCSNLPRSTKFFCESLLAEQKLSDPSKGVPPCWSAIGDYYFGGPDFIDAAREVWKSGFSYAAPRVNGLIPVDLWSPYARSVAAMNGRPFSPYTPQEIASISLAIGKALTATEGSSESSATLVHLFIKAIVARKDITEPNRVGSSSTLTRIGQIVLRNPHDMKLSEIADGLVHEGIHALLDTFEIDDPFVTNPSAGNTNVVSPWTGKVLNVRTYIHACFVWYGLAMFWLQSRPAAMFAPSEVRERLERAIEGFRTENPVERLVPHKRMIKVRILEMIASLRDVLASCCAF
jgi:hypothetical protein